MHKITITIDKAKVYDEVAKHSSYLGAKGVDDDGAAYERVFTTDEDKEMLETFWSEAVGMVVDATKDFAPVPKTDDNFAMTLTMSDRFDTSWFSVIQKEMFWSMMYYIAAKWYMFVHKESSAPYATIADGHLTTARKLLYKKKGPVRPGEGVVTPPGTDSSDGTEGMA